MSVGFDPYFKWLAIPQQEQPPNHYRLLGVPEFISDLDVIEHASDQRMTYLRKFAIGEHSALSQKLLNEVALAKVVLFNAEKKAAYDARLRNQIAARSAKAATLAQEAAPALETHHGAGQALPAANPLFDLGQMPESQFSSPPLATVTANNQNNLLIMVGLGVLAIVIGGAAFALLSRSPQAPPVDANPPIAQSDTSTVNSGAAVEPDASAKIPETNSIPPSEPDSPPMIEEAPVEDPESMESETPVAEEELTPAPELPEEEIATEPAEPSEPSEPTEPAVAEETATAEDAVPAELPAEEAPQPVVKLPVPSADELRTARRELVDAYADQFKSARDARTKIKLARDLLELDQSSSESPAARYTMLTEAIKFASEGGDVRLAINAVNAIAADFEVDAWTMKVDTLQAAARNATTKDQIAVTGGVTAEVASEAYDSRAYDEALKVARIAETLGKRAGDVSYTKKVRDRMAEMLQAKTKHAQRLVDQAQRQEAVAKAQATLVQHPHDGQANFIMGTYQAFEKDDWPGGLALLMKGNEVSIAQAAKMDLAATAPSSTDCLQLADAWWDLAQGRSEWERAGFLFRAGWWYEKASPEVSEGLPRKKIENRLTTIYEEAGNMPSLAGSALQRVLTQGALLVMTFDKASLSHRGGKRVVNDLSGTGKQGTIEGATSRAGIAGDALSFDGADDFVNLTDFRFNQRDYTVCVWVRGKGTVLGTGQNAEWPMYWMLTTEKVVHHIEPFRGGGREYDAATYRDTLAIQSLPDNEWKHLAVTRRGNVMRVYVDGKLEAERVPYQGEPFVTHADWGLFLGMIKTWGITSVSVGGNLPRVNRFTGLIDELAVFDRALSDIDLLAVFQFGSRGQSLLAAPLRRAALSSAR